MSNIGSTNDARIWGPGFTFKLSVYEFDDDGLHCGTRIYNDPVREDLKMVETACRRWRSEDSSIPPGLVVSIEDLASSRRFRAMIVGLDLLVATKRCVHPDHFAGYRIAGTAYGATVANATLVDGRSVWSLVAVGYDKERRELHGWDATVAWVLRNGTVAMEKWESLGLMGGALRAKQQGA